MLKGCQHEMAAFFEEPGTMTTWMVSICFNRKSSLVTKCYDPKKL